MHSRGVEIFFSRWFFAAARKWESDLDEGPLFFPSLKRFLGNLKFEIRKGTKRKKNRPRSPQEMRKILASLSGIIKHALNTQLRDTKPAITGDHDGLRPVTDGTKKIRT